MVALADITPRTQRLEIPQHRLPTLRPRHDVIDMQGHGGILRRAGAAHAAEAVVADQHGGAQAPADLAARLGLRSGARRERIAVVSFAREYLEGAERLVLGPEAPLVGGAGELREAAALGELAADRLAAELAPDVGQVLEQHRVGHAPQLVHLQAGRSKRRVPRAEAARQRARAEGAVLGIERQGHALSSGRARHAAQVPDQFAVGDVAEPEAHEFYPMGRHPHFIKSVARIANYGRYWRYSAGRLEVLALTHCGARACCGAGAGQNSAPSL